MYEKQLLEKETKLYAKDAALNELAARKTAGRLNFSMNVMPSLDM